MELLPKRVRPILEPPYKMEPFSSLILTCTDIDILTLPLESKFVYATTAHGKRFFARIPRFRKSLLFYQKTAAESKDTLKENPIIAELIK